ncbi:MAG: Gfo/Idh/MocA family oxidoreductase, partial [Chloroflexota bacterium]|nr:Gfo/Idh/MocA family oxidoreductase [Chloroflexota bacterium]
YPSLDAALADATADAVLVATPPATHRAVAEAALAAGAHVLLEKPLATTIEDARALVAAADGAGRTLMVSQNYRFRRPARAVQQLVAEGAIGALLSVAIRCRRDTRALWPADDFRYRMEHPFILDMSIHHLDLLRALTGREATRLVARGWRVPDSPFRHDPAVVALVDLEDGAGVTYEGTWATHEPETSWNGDWDLLGEQGRFTWTGGLPDATVGDVTLHRWGEPPRAVAQPRLAHVDRAGTLHAFRLAIETGAEPETRACDNLKSLALVLACAASVESGAPVDLATWQV